MDENCIPELKTSQNLSPEMMIHDSRTSIKTIKQKQITSHNPAAVFFFFKRKHRGKFRKENVDLLYRGQIFNNRLTATLLNTDKQDKLATQ